MTKLERQQNALRRELTRERALNGSGDVRRVRELKRELRAIALEAAPRVAFEDTDENATETTKRRVFRFTRETIE